MTSSNTRVGSAAHEDNAKRGDAAEAVNKAPGGGAYDVRITWRFSDALFDVVSNCITIYGSFVGGRDNIAETPAFVAASRVKANLDLQALSAVNTVLTRLQRYEATERGA